MYHYVKTLSALISQCPPAQPVLRAHRSKWDWALNSLEDSPDYTSTSFSAAAAPSARMSNDASNSRTLYRTSSVRTAIEHARSFLSENLTIGESSDDPPLEDPPVGDDLDDVAMNDAYAGPANDGAPLGEGAALAEASPSTETLSDGNVPHTPSRQRRAATTDSPPFEDLG